MAARKYEPGDIINGIRFLKDLPKKPGNRHRWMAFECPYCGNEFHAYSFHVTSGNNIGCGCQKYKNPYIKHGESAEKTGKRTTEYITWHKMKQRCLNPNNYSYSNYGGRGIKIHQSWIDSFEQFLKDVGRKPSSKHSLDRFPNMNGHYEPGNVRWATTKEQNNNTRKTIFIKYNGNIKCVSQWAEELKLNAETIRSRYKAGMSLERVFSAERLRKQKRRAKSNFIPHTFGFVDAKRSYLN